MSINELSQSHIAQESIDLYHELKENHIDGPWSPSPVEEKDFLLREFFINKIGILDKFRRTFLVAGRQNFPDSPRGGFYTEWGVPGAVPLQLRLHGKFLIYKMVFKLFLYKKFRLNLKNLQDTMIAMPVPQSIFGYKITESQIRNYYYCEELKKNLGSEHDIVVEIGGGFGGLAGEILTNLNVKQYYLVELFDAIPLAYYYLRNLLGKEYKIQVIKSENCEIDEQAKVVILAPNFMNKIKSKASTFINTMSFQHMNEEAVDYYLKQADRLNSKHIFLNNRDWIRDPSDIVISKYPIPPNYKKILWKKWLYGKHTLAIYKSD